MVLAGGGGSRVFHHRIFRMTGFEVIYQLLTDETDRQAIFAAMPTIQADIDIVADDIIKLGRDIKTLNARCSNLINKVQRVLG